MRNNFMKALTELARANPRLMLLTADLGWGVLEGFAAEFPTQYLNVGVAEQNMIGVATGLALEGRIVFLYSIANFPTLRCLEQIRNDACYHGANVKIVAVGGGLSYGPLGVSHHAIQDLSILRALPDITLVAPGDDWEAGEATTAIAETPGTCYLRLDKSSAGDTSRAGETFQLGKARTLSEGSAFTLISTGGILGVVLQAAHTLREIGVDCRVLSMHTVKPIDKGAVLSAASETGGIVTVEEHTLDGGLGSAIAEVCVDEGVLPKRFRRLGLRAGFPSIVGSQGYLREQYGMDEKAITETVNSLL
jgi:transketolase